MKDIEKAQCPIKVTASRVMQLGRNATNYTTGEWDAEGFERREQMIKFLTEQFEQYHQEQLSKLPTDAETLATQEAYQRGFDEGAQAAANDILG